MFSMFGRTGAPTKGAPTRGPALLSTESELLREIQFDDILDDFAAWKASKVYV